MAKQNIVTPIGTFIYPKISQPDTKGDFADDKFKTHLELAPADLAAFKKQVADWAKGQTFKVKQPKMPFKTLKDGREVVYASSKFAPVVGDRFRKPLPDDAVIGGGTTGRLALEPYNYEKGVSLRLKKVQVVELQSYGGLDEFDELPDDGFGSDDSDEGTDNGNGLDI